MAVRHLGMMLTSICIQVKHLMFCSPGAWMWLWRKVQGAGLLAFEQGAWQPTTISTAPYNGRL
jgi:hypothetical protein